MGATLSVAMFDFLWITGKFLLVFNSGLEFRSIKYVLSCDDESGFFAVCPTLD